MNVVETEARKLSFRRSHLWDGTNANTVDEGTLENLAFLQERCTKRERERGRGKNMIAGEEK